MSTLVLVFILTLIFIAYKLSLLLSFVCYYLYHYYFFFYYYYYS